MNAPRVDLAALLIKALTFSRQWRDQDGCNRQVLDELADAIDGYVKSRSDAQVWLERVEGVHPDAVIIDDPLEQVPASCDAHPASEVCPDCAPMIAEVMNRVHVRRATDDEQREALERGLQRGPLLHIELQLQHLVHTRGLHGMALVRNASTVELEVVKRDGTSTGFPPSAIGEVFPGDVVRTPPGRDYERPHPVSDDELETAQRIGMAAYRSSPTVDFLWVTRLPDGRALFLLPWNSGGLQLSVGTLGSVTFTGTWNYHAAQRDAAWRAVLSWDGHGVPDGWTEASEVRP